MLPVIFAILCSIASYGLYLILNMIGVLPHSTGVGGFIALASLVLFLVLGFKRKDNITIKTLGIPIILIVIVSGIFAISTLTNPANALPSGARAPLDFVTGLCNSNLGRCKVWSVQKGTIIPQNSSWTSSDETWCIQTKVTPTSGDSYFVYNVIYFRNGEWNNLEATGQTWLINEVEELGCTNHE